MIPDITGLPCDEITNTAGHVYMRRYYIHRRKDGRSERIHHILLSDERDMHDHPWHFNSVILHGTYTEHTAHSVTTYTEGARIQRQAQDAHRLELTEPVWTHVHTSPYLRTWGFHTDNGWQDFRMYLTDEAHQLARVTPRPNTRQW